MQRRRLGILLLAAGVGLLVARLVPGSALLWPLGLILGGVMLWRGLGTPEGRLFILAASVTVAVATPEFGLRAPLTPEFGGSSGRVIASFESTPEQAEAWAGVRTLVVQSSVGELRVEGGADEVALKAEYRRRGQGAPVPSALQTSFDAATQTLTFVGVDPNLPQSERRGLSATLTVAVPGGVALRATGQVLDVRAAQLAAATVNTNVGDVRLTEVEGAVVVDADVGDVTVEDATGEVGVASRVGEISLDFGAPVTAPVIAKTDVGDIELSLPEESDVLVRALSQMRGFSGDLERVSATERRLQLGSGTQPVTLQTRVGEVEVEVE